MKGAREEADRARNLAAVQRGEAAVKVSRLLLPLMQAAVFICTAVLQLPPHPRPSDLSGLLAGGINKEAGPACS